MRVFGTVVSVSVFAAFYLPAMKVVLSDTMYHISTVLNALPQ